MIDGHRLGSPRRRVIGALIVIYSLGYMAHEGRARYYALVMFFIGGMIGMALSDSLLFLFFFWEVIGVCSYALIGFYHKDPKAAAAGMKAFLTTKVGDFCLLGGILLLYWNGPRTFSLSVITQSQHLYSEGSSAWRGLFSPARRKSAQCRYVWLPTQWKPRARLALITPPPSSTRAST
jgi:NADH:ubiquinone oxidoreductase subunit 5 (subunit L)/multisubunit Na+/H+ antiporter MnhA subunit